MVATGAVGEHQPRPVAVYLVVERGSWNVHERHASLYRASVGSPASAPRRSRGTPPSADTRCWYSSTGRCAVLTDAMSRYSARARLTLLGRTSNYADSA